MKAFLYAAGRAVRLGAEFAEQPKILIEIGGKSLLEWNILSLAELGVTEISIVTGHCREAIQRELPVLEKRHGVRLIEVFNPHYTEGSVLSVQVSLAGFAGSETPVLLMDGDVFFDPEVLRRLVESKHRTALLIDREFSTADDDPVLVPVKGGKPVEFLKKWTGQADLVGESIGFFKIDPSDIPPIVDACALRSTGDRRRESYDEIIRDLVLQGRFGFEDVTGIPWTEIDFPNDVEVARNEVHPAIARAQSASLSGDPGVGAGAKD